MATYQFACASPVCKTRIEALTRDELIAQLTEHIKVSHRIASPTRPILQFLQDNTIHEVARPKGRS